MTQSRTLFVAACFGLLALFPLVAGNYGIDFVTKIMVYAIFALSLELLVGGPSNLELLLCGGGGSAGAFAACGQTSDLDPANQWVWLTNGFG